MTEFGAADARDQVPDAESVPGAESIAGAESVAGAEAVPAEAPAGAEPVPAEAVAAEAVGTESASSEPATPVAAALRGLEQLPELDLAEHPDVYQRIHTELQAALASIDDA